MDRVITTSNYGICVYSMEVLQEFLKKEKIRSKKLLDVFNKDKEKFLKLQREGIWVPFVGINSIGYSIKIKNHGEEFDADWEKRMEYGGFNLAIKNGVWISVTGSFLKFNAKEFEGEGQECIGEYGTREYFSNRERWYTTLDGNKLYTDFWYDIPEGKYLLSIKGYARKEIVDPRGINYGFQFEFTKVDEFEGYKNPREEVYDFNVAKL